MCIGPLSFDSVLNVWRALLGEVCRVMESKGNLAGGRVKRTSALGKGDFNLVTGGTLPVAFDQYVSSWCGDKSN